MIRYQPLRKARTPNSPRPALVSTEDDPLGKLSSWEIAPPCHKALGFLGPGLPGQSLWRSLCAQPAEGRCHNLIEPLNPGAINTGESLDQGIKEGSHRCR